jgi:hypothetical protein
MNKFLFFSVILASLFSCDHENKASKKIINTEVTQLENYFPDFEKKGKINAYHLTKSNTPVILFSYDTIGVWYYRHKLQKNVERKIKLVYNPFGVGMKFPYTYKIDGPQYIAYEYATNHNIPYGELFLVHNGRVSNFIELDSNITIWEVNCSKLLIAFGDSKNQLTSISINEDRKKMKRQPLSHNLYCVSVIGKEYLQLYILSSERRKLTPEIVANYFKH